MLAKMGVEVEQGAVEGDRRIDGFGRGGETVVVSDCVSVSGGAASLIATGSESTPSATTPLTASAPPTSSSLWFVPTSRHAVLPEHRREEG
jgi:hypothetical protein